MTAAVSLLPAAVLLPLGVACMLLMLAHWLPPKLSHVIAILTTLLTCATCVWLASRALDHPIAHWFGGWTPATADKPGLVLGISFVATGANCAVAAFCALLFAMSFVFAWGYFDPTHSHFQILMLFFLSALIGFCLTHDLFNLFVWFELMSVAAFATTAYPLGKSSLEGAFNFTITNALASFLMLAGVGLLYARTGTLDFTLMGQKAAAAAADPVLLGGFLLVAVALLTKGAILPFNLWLADAHSVAPSPVSMVFSGAMVGVALFGLTRLVADVFLHNAAVMGFVRVVLPWLGVATAMIGAVMAWSQRHLKRLLAFSTIAHMGVMLTASASFEPVAHGGMLLYLAGHGLVKATLFMLTGILLALRASADEIVLYARGRELWPAGVAMALGGSLLGGLPVGLMHGAMQWMKQTQSPSVQAIQITATALTGAAVLRAAARIFLGCSGAPGLECSAPTEREHEKAQRPLWLMLLPCYVLLALNLLPASLTMSFLETAVGQFDHTDAAGVLSPPASSGAETLVPVTLMAVILAVALMWRRPVGRMARVVARVAALPVRALQFLHSGVVGDYVAWMVFGLAVLATTFWGATN